MGEYCIYLCITIRAVFLVMESAGLIAQKKIGLRNSLPFSHQKEHFALQLFQHCYTIVLQWFCTNSIFYLFSIYLLMCCHNFVLCKGEDLWYSASNGHTGFVTLCLKWSLRICDTLPHMVTQDLWHSASNGHSDICRVTFSYKCHCDIIASNGHSDICWVTF